MDIELKENVVNFIESEKWLLYEKTKNRFKQYFNTTKEYNSFIKLITETLGV